MKKFSFSSFFIIILSLTLVSFQNCSQVRFNLLPGVEINLKSNNNGTGYSGKPKGDFYRFQPGFTCENKEAAVSSIHITDIDIKLIENKKLQCASSTLSIDPKLIDDSIYQTDIIGYQEAILESQKTTPVQIPANLVEVWCRTSRDTSGIETITHYNRLTSEADTEIYFTGQSGPLKETHVVSRVVSALRVTVMDEKGLLIEVYRDQPSTELGLFKGHLTAVINGQNVSTETLCRLGGSLDTAIWPAQQIVDMKTEMLKVEPNRNFFVFSAALSSLVPTALFSSDAMGFQQKQISPNMISAGIGNFEFTKDPNTLVYWGDARYPDGRELFRVDRDGGNHLQLNEPITNSQQSQVTDIKFSADGTQVYYRDGQQETEPEGSGDIEMWLRFVPITGGTPTVVNPVLPLVGDEGVHQFGISNSTHRIAYLAGRAYPDLYVSNLDGTNLIKPQTDASLSWTQDITVPEPGYYFFIDTLVSGPAGRLNLLTYAFDFNGVDFIKLPLNAKLKSIDASGHIALIADTETPTVIQGKNYFATKLLNLKTGATIHLGLAANAQFNRQKKGILATFLDKNSKPQTRLYDLESKTWSDLCLGVQADELVVKELESGKYLVSAYSQSSKILQLYTQDPAGTCQKRNSIPVDIQTMKEMIASPDEKRVLVKVGIISNGKAHDQLYYLPLDGTVPLSVNAALFSGAKIEQFFFLKDSKTVIFYGDQMALNYKTIFRWQAP